MMLNRMSDDTTSFGRKRKRRTYLKKVGGVVGVSMMGSLAGCGGGSDGGSGGSGGSDGSGSSDGGGGSDGSGGSDGGGDETTEQSGYDREIDKAFMSPDSLKIDLWKAFRNGMKEAANDFGMTASAQDHGGQLSKQISQIEGAITSGADMVAATAPSDSGVKSLAETAVA